MSLSPHNDDKNRNKVLKHIEKLHKDGSAQAGDQLKEEFNIDVDDKSSIIIADDKPVDKSPINPDN